MDIELTNEQQLHHAKVMDTATYKFFRGVAAAFTCSGKVIETGSHGVAAALRATANGVEKGGDTAATFLYGKGELFNAKAENHREETEKLEKMESDFGSVLAGLSDMAGTDVKMSMTPEKMSKILSAVLGSEDVKVSVKKVDQVVTATA